jgi:hypothetical protein
MPEEVEGDDEWLVECIVDERQRGCQIEHLVRWQGYGESEDEWKTEEQLSNATVVLQAWKTRKSQTEESLPSVARVVASEGGRYQVALDEDFRPDARI